jgi:hypothetical protein
MVMGNCNGDMPFKFNEEEQADSRLFVDFVTDMPLLLL